ncbi:hypothetical protein EMCRGX_G029081 [Ephydatia muelleri]
MVVPDGWFNYTCFGEPIRNTRILAAKTPLKQSFNSGEKRSALKDDFRTVAVEEEFTPTHLMDMLEEKQHTLGLVIDLTFTSRYYSPREFEDRGVLHVKILCPGRDIPDDDVYSQFAEVLNAFLADPSKKEKLVAIHCTHGLNRTGYLICRYLFEECHYEVEDAIDAFNHARGHCIERKNYLDHLRKGCPKLTHELNQSNKGTSNGQQRGDMSNYQSYHRPANEEYRPLPLHRQSGQALRHTHSPALQYRGDRRPSAHRYDGIGHSSGQAMSSRHGSDSQRRCVDNYKDRHYRNSPYGHRDRPYGHTDRPYGHTDRPHGHTDRPHGHTDRRPYGHTDCRPHGHTNRHPYGHTDHPYGHTDRPHGHTDRDYRRDSEFSSDHWSSDSCWEPRPVEQSQRHRKPPHSNSSHIY